MSLASSLNKITSFTNKLIGVTNPMASGANVSVGSWGRVMGISDLSFNSIADTKRSISEIKGTLAQTINTAACLKYMLWDNPAEMLDFLDQLATGVIGAIGSVVDQIYDAVSYQITAAVSQIAGSILSLVGALQQLVSSVLLLFDVICDTVKSWLDWSNLKMELELQQENCKDMFAAIAACFLNKYLGKYLDDFAEKTVAEINKMGNELNKEIYEGLQDVNTFASFARQEAFLLNKASIQIKGLSKENLLG